ncbi:MAG: ethanolamine utilization protein EutN, partial [Clostridia bacterium]|nr:ethanolamine utilization protein EutN [Clostridia bacterium]
IGERVLITTGSGARLAMDKTNVPTDAVIVGIVD